MQVNDHVWRFMLRSGTRFAVSGLCACVGIGPVAGATPAPKGVAELSADVYADDGKAVMPRHFGRPRSDHRPDNRWWTGIPSIECAPNGRLWATWFSGITPGEDQNSYVVLSTSGDGGETWTEVAVCDPDATGPIRAMDPNVWAAPDGTLWWTWSEYEFGGKDALHHLKLHRAVAADANAPEPRWRSHAGDEFMDGVMLGDPLVLKDGAWALPVARWFLDGGSALWTSDDGGRTWARRGGADVPKPYRDANEHEVVEVGDGRLWCVSRSLLGAVESFSSDGGRTWSSPSRTWFHQPVSRLALKRLPSGNIVMVTHGSPLPRWCLFEPRTHLTASISTDGGRSWKKSIELYANECSYPNLAIGPDGTIYCCYDVSRGDNGAIQFATFREEDLIAGTVNSPTVRLKRLITQSTNPKCGGRDRK